MKSYNDGITQGQYQYDALYRKINETVNYGPFSKSIQYDYYKNGLKKTYKDPVGIAYTYSYDLNNQLSSIQIPDQGIISYQSYKWLAPTQITLPGGTKKEYEYDPLMRIKKITSFDPGQNVLLNYQYSYDKMDNIRTKATEHGNYSYNYDDLYRLTDDKRPATAESYAYDQVGNRLQSISGVTVNWTYNQNNELQNYDGVTFQYDANGNLIQKTTDNGQLVTVDYEYDIENRLISVTRFTSGVSPFTVSYEYDPFGRRLWKELDGQRTYFIYCDEGLAGELDQNGSLTKAYGYRPNSTWTTDPVFMREGESYYYYHNDHLGTPQKMTAQNGQVLWQAKYSAFGEAKIDPASTIINNLRFPGQYQDNETGLYYNWNRYYDTRSGRYLTPDPIGQAGGINLFSYLENNPITFIDPEGLISENTYKHTTPGSMIFPIPPRPKPPCMDETCRNRGRNPFPEERMNSPNPNVAGITWAPGIHAPDGSIIEKLQCMHDKLGTNLYVSSGYRPYEAGHHSRGDGVDISRKHGGTKGYDPCLIKRAALSCGFTRVCLSLIFYHIHVDTGSAGFDCRSPGWQTANGGPYADPCDPQIMQCMIFPKIR